MNDMEILHGNLNLNVHCKIYNKQAIKNYLLTKNIRYVFPTVLKTLFTNNIEVFYQNTSGRSILCL